MKEQKAYLELGEEIVRKLQREGYLAYFAGGWVRDFLMSLPSDDIDIVTEASVEEILSLFPKTVPVGIRFGIVIVVEGGERFEVATFRKDHTYKDGRRPTGFAKASPEKDAERRDFTINGMFYDPVNGELIDYVGGHEDLQRGIVRAIGNPRERFLEDRLRMIRAIRYASRFRFVLETETLKAVIDHAHLLFPAVAIERVWGEFRKMARYPGFDTALITLHRLNLLSVIFPQLKEVSTGEIAKRLSTLPRFPEKTPVIVKILELFPETTLREKEAIATYLKVPNREKLFVRFLHLTQTVFLDPNPEPYDLARCYADHRASLCLHICAARLPPEKRDPFLARHTAMQRTLEEPVRRLEKKKPYLTATDLKRVGIPEGEEMGRLLREGEKIAINARIYDPKEIMKSLGLSCEERES
ncbi:MAG: CCA tRNA nucleotidyltransferase [Simkaniaceae bacterium]|nr:CCA tRNA nucleotidyltransferase [Simkaniaceae bacterium]